MLVTLALLLAPAVVPQQAPGEGPSHLGAYSFTVSGLARPIAVAFGRCDASAAHPDEMSRANAPMPAVIGYMKLHEVTAKNWAIT